MVLIARFGERVASYGGGIAGAILGQQAMAALFEQDMAMAEPETPVLGLTAQSDHGPELLFT